MNNAPENELDILKFADENFEETLLSFSSKYPEHSREFNRLLEIERECRDYLDKVMILQEEWKAVSDEVLSSIRG